MRILHVVTRLGLGGAERVAETLASRMATGGNEITFVPVAASRDRAIADDMQASLVAAGVGVIDAGSMVTAKVAVLAAAGRLAETVERFRPDLVHLHTEIPEFAWVLAGLRSRRARDVPLVRTVHNTVLWGGWGRLGRFAERRLDRASVAAVSEAASDAFVAWRVTAGRQPGNPVVIYNGVDVGALGDPPRKGRTPPLLCFAGRFEPQKGIDVLLAAMGHLTASDPPHRLAIYGSGTLEGAVSRAAEAWPDRLVVGPPRADLRSHLGSFDAILLPSRFEGLSVLAIEALCSGVPVIATSAKGLDEVFPEGYPRRCTPGDPVAFASLVRDFLTNRETWMAEAEAARAEASRRFSLGTMVERYEHLYGDALDRERSGS